MEIHHGSAVGLLAFSRCLLVGSGGWVGVWAAELPLTSLGVKWETSAYWDPAHSPAGCPRLAPNFMHFSGFHQWYRCVFCATAGGIHCGKVLGRRSQYRRQKLWAHVIKRYLMPPFLVKNYYKYIFHEIISLLKNFYKPHRNEMLFSFQDRFIFHHF